ncbi:MAG TPA: chaperonin GroEL [Roseiflexaceae bacterium]|nr:chaperonin GroEL [Roseiflexaceae bacterium]
MPTPQVLFGDTAREQVKHGIDLLAELVSLTLGPRAGAVFATRDSKIMGPESLTSSAIIARRIVEVNGRGANVGTMMLRHALWQMHEQLGDGGATMAALAHALLAGGERQIAAGANPMLLRRGIERGVRTALIALAEQVRPLDQQQHLAGLAHAATGDAELGAVFGTIYGQLGPECTIRIEEYAATYLAHQFLEGSAWDGTFVSPHFIADQAGSKTRLHNLRILLADQTISDPRDLLGLLEQLVRQQAGSLLIIANDVTDAARTLLLANRSRGIIDVAAAKLLLVGEHRRETLADIAALTNAYLFDEARGDRLATAGLSELGSARMGQVDAKQITLVGGAGHAPLIDARREQVRRQLTRADQEAARQNIVERLGKLAGGMAVLKLGAASNSERALRKEIAERFIRFVPVALEEGVVPGGGAAYLACQAALDDLAGGIDEEAVGAALVRSALEAPMRWLIRNARQPVAPALAAVRRHGAAAGYDVVGEQVVDMWQANIIDAAKVARIALTTAASIASMALTTDVVVLRRRPAVSSTP